jgi:hypothetical protein
VATSEPIPFAVGDIVRLRKVHPCGGLDWTVVRLGADIGLKCHGCGRRILLPRRVLERRMRHRIAVTASPANGFSNGAAEAEA